MSVLIVALLVAAPAIFVVERLIEQAAASVSLIQDRLRSGAIQQLLDTQPGIAPVGQWIEQQIDLPAMIANLASWLSNAGAAFARNSAVQVIELVLTFYLLFYFLRDQATARRFLTERLPLTSAETERLFTGVLDTVHATVFGTIAVAAIQGTLGGLIFWFLGLPTPLLWGLVMGLLSIVPVLGAFIVWIPAAILLAMNGDLGKAAILAVLGRPGRRRDRQYPAPDLCRKPAPSSYRSRIHLHDWWHRPVRDGRSDSGASGRHDHDHAHRNLGGAGSNRLPRIGVAARQ
ncbi:AI-2E family transporter [Aurantimonas sp. A3-2-R12]|uniref:AI-2E family transporter n=1 Tax=Aurantimonas sp. A3-2-R12 TaxID=3114362 RepID=UPI002E17A5C3|nr:AI-2E family transporter [Aurantimonas sp. A3-2-R12]